MRRAPTSSRSWSGMQPGGQLTITTDVENYPGFADVIQGPWLMEQMQTQAEHVGTQIILDMITELDLSRRPFVATGDCGDRYSGDTLIVATGAQARWLGLPERADVPRLWRLGLRHLRRLLLPRQGVSIGRRRQHRGRGSAVPDQPRDQGDPDPPARRVPRREDHAGPAVPQPEDRGHLGHRGRGDPRRSRRARRRSPACSCATSRPARFRTCRSTASSSRSATTRPPSSSGQAQPLRRAIS